ncbi:MAG: FKBP-type peptidyl-prolyl cis-trans isomerase [Chlamydiales bacterium]|nr:FKBP-type peptidyl-prolyl cis-trans isomerase [Chlamydiia bacterium]MCP5507914.1 FKBP-type peptidyl-prolyl cis-trans isomerase [Chlamydiales bacterium]
MTEAKQGHKVKVNFTGKLDDGSVFDTSTGKEPLEFTIGGGQILPHFEEAVVGMTIGDKKTFKIKADDAYGPHRPDLIVEVPKDRLPEGLSPEPEQYLQLDQGNGVVIPVRVVSVTDSTITIDANHPLVGKDLTFEIELIEVV